MQSQQQAFGGDEFICEEFINIRDRFQINTAIETGCAAAKWLTGQFEKYYLADNPNKLIEVLRTVGNRTIIFLNSESSENFPLKNYLAAISNSGLRPVIAIYDFFVPGEAGLGCDSYNGQPFTFEWLKPSIDLIYNERRIDDRKVPDDYEYYYNSFERSAGARRGCIFITPK